MERRLQPASALTHPPSHKGGGLFFARTQCKDAISTTSAEEAAFMLSRFLTPKVAEAGRHHPEESVRQLSLGYLKELAEEGDPFAKEILEK